MVPQVTEIFSFLILRKSSGTRLQTKNNNTSLLLLIPNRFLSVFNMMGKKFDHNDTRLYMYTHLYMYTRLYMYTHLMFNLVLFGLNHTFCLPSACFIIYFPYFSFFRFNSFFSPIYLKFTVPHFVFLLCC